MKKVIVLALVVVCILLMYQFPHAMLNPGELSQGHQKLNNKCLDCHNPFWGIANDKCITCHKLSEIDKDTMEMLQGDAVSTKIRFHKFLANQKCTSCHTDHKGLKPEMTLSEFNHDLLPTAMINSCNKCHGQPSDNLHRQLTDNCSSCHNSKGWKQEVVFHHDMIQIAAKTNCVSCHETPDDNFHKQLKDNCDKCHSTTKWKPSTFDHSLYFLLDNDHNVECKTCHTNNNYSVYTCYSCHEHSESKIQDEHYEHGIYQFNDCASCHRSSDKHDIKKNSSSNQNMNQQEINKVKEFMKTQKKDNEKKKDEKKEHDDD